MHCIIYYLHNGSLIDNWADQIAYKCIDHSGRTNLSMCSKPMFIVGVFQFFERRLLSPRAFKYLDYKGIREKKI